MRLGITRYNVFVWGLLIALAIAGLDTANACRPICEFSQSP